MKIKNLLATLTILLVVLMSGCKKSEYKGTVGVCPLVVSTIPANGAAGVPLNQVVSATFNEKMNSATITKSSFILTASITVAGITTKTEVDGAVSYSGMTAFFTSTVLLTPNTTYTGRVKSSVRDLAGNALQTDYVWTFSTDVPPTVSTNPANGAVDVLLNRNVIATFSVPMDSLTLKTPSSTYTIKQGSTDVPGKFSYTGNTATFTPTGTLAPFTVYTGKITTGAKNMLGTPMAADYIWSFTTIPQLTLSSNPVLGGTTSGAGTFAQGSSVTVVATPATGFSFINWTEGVNIVSTSASYQFAMAGNKTLVANFTIIPYTVAVSSNPTLGGITSGGGTFNSGATVAVTAVPNGGYTFTNWTEAGTVVSTTAAYTFILIGNRTLVANYTAIPYTVAVSSNPIAGGITSGGGTFNSGATVALTAVAHSGYTFTNWTENGTIVSTTAAYSFIIIGNRTLVANYTAIPYTVAVSSNPVIGGITSGGGTFNSGATVALTAAANSGYTFTNWTEGGTIVSTNAAYTFIIIGNRTLVANYTAIPYTVAVSSNPIAGGITSGGGTFNSGATVALTAVAHSGYTFTNWTEGGTIVSTTAAYTFIIIGNRTLVANYTLIPATQYTVSLSSNPLIGGTTTGAGSFNSGASVTVNAVANFGYTFTNWTESGTVVSTTAGYTFTISGNRTLVANFTAVPASQFTVSLSSNPLLGGTTTGAGSFVSGSSVAVTALANIGYTFTNWTEGVNIVSTSANYIFVISGNRTLVANFTVVPPSQFAVNLSSNPPLGGTTTGGGSFNSGVSVSVTATPNVGYTFTNWTESGTIVSAVAGYTFNILGNRTLVANFSAITYTLGVIAINGSVLKNPNQVTYNSGSDVVLTATPNSGFVFTSWSGDATGSVNPLTVTMNSNKNVTANFTAIASTYTLNVIANNGSVLKNPDLFAYNSGASVLLTATPNSGYTFTSWSGDATGSVNPLTVIMNSNKNITANFTLSPPVGPGIVDLGTAGNYVTLTKSGISTTGVTSITGDIAVSPVAATGITGFGLIMDTNGQSSHTTIVSGKVYAADYAAPTPANLTTAVSDMETAFTTANNLVVPAPIVGLYSGNISGRILPAGLYKWSTGVLITNAGVTLTGGANDTWVFQIAQNLTVDNSAIITLLGGAQAKNIFWVVTGESTLGSNVNFSGNILCKTLISLNTGASVTGRLLAQTAVTLNASTVIMP